MAEELLYNYIENTGVVIPDTSDIKADVQEEFKNALGQSMQTSDDTPQGRLISGEVSARRAVAENNALLANQINPALAGGVFLESICALLGIERKGESASVIPDVRLTGKPRVEIPALAHVVLMVIIIIQVEPSFLTRLESARLISSQKKPEH